MARAFHTKKRLGQHFLVNPDALQEIADALEAKPGDKVLEIGPGLGFLTRFLSDTGADITAVELDREAVEDLRSFNFPNVNIVHGDFLAFDIGQVGENIKVVGNVPYQITSPIVARIFGEIGQPQPWSNRIDRIVLTVQREVAFRFVATPGCSDYSMISLLVHYFSRARIVSKLPREDFFPPPDVNSAIVEFIPHRTPPIQCGHVKLLRQVIKVGFGQRRKMLKNNLTFLQASPDDINRAFEQAKIDAFARAESLSLEQFARLSDALSQIDHRVVSQKDT